MIQPIYLYGSEVLRKKAEPVDLAQKDEIAKLVQDLKDTLANAEGCGLAAPQIGESIRMIVVEYPEDDSVEDSPMKTYKVINPEIIWRSEETVAGNEGCLSIPGIYGDVRRPATMTVEYYDENLEKVTETFDRFGCRMIQHELSHLDGDMFVDHVAPIRKKMITKKLANIAHGRVGARYNTKIK